MSGLEPMPAGLRVVLDSTTRRIDERTLLGGRPARMLRLSPLGAEALREIDHAPLQSRRSRLLARRLTDAGLAHPRPIGRAPTTATVVIPVRNRGAELERCLAALGGSQPVVVVDDGSRDAASIADIAAAHGARVLRRDASGGPGAARNTALAAVDTDVVVFLDSDCEPPTGWIDRLIGHLDDPLVAAVAPRIVPAATDTPARRYAGACSCLDLGPQEARVVPLGPVSYLPTAALVVRRSALLDISTGPAVFDESMRYGEDVDLVWRLHEAGWRVRYDPSVEVRHAEPATWRALLARRFRYGTSAAPLARRHPTATAPLVVRPGAAIMVAALVACRPLLVMTGFVVGVVSTRRARNGLGLPPASPVVSNARMIGRTWIGASRYLTQFASPMILAAGFVGSRSGRHRRRVAAGAVLLTPGLHSWWSSRTAVDPAQVLVGDIADSVAYGAGVWAGCLRARTFAPLRPRLVEPIRGAKR